MRQNARKIWENVVQSALMYLIIMTSHNTNLMTNRLMRPDCFERLDLTEILNVQNSISKDPVSPFLSNEF